MSRKYKWLLSIMMLAVMVIAMATACGSKKEEAAEPEKKEETKVEAEKEAEDRKGQTPDDAHGSPDLRRNSGRKHNSQMIDKHSDDGNPLQRPAA